MHQPKKRSQSITHALTSRLQHHSSIIQQQQYPPVIQQKKQPKDVFNPYKIPKYHNPLSERSRKHRLVEERNTEIQKTNRILYEKIRRIKLKSMYHSQRKIDPSYDIQLPIKPCTVQRKDSNPLKLPQIPIRQRNQSTSSISTISNNLKSMSSTKSYLNNLTSILEDRTQFVQQYFNDLSSKNKLDEKQLAIVVTENGWKVRVVQVGEERLLLVGKKGRSQLTKKYLLSKVSAKMQNGLQAWVKYKFQFQE